MIVNYVRVHAYECNQIGYLTLATDRKHAQKTNLTWSAFSCPFCRASHVSNPLQQVILLIFHMSAKCKKRTKDMQIVVPAISLGNKKCAASQFQACNKSHQPNTADYKIQDLGSSNFRLWVTTHICSCNSAAHIWSVDHTFDRFVASVGQWVCICVYDIYYKIAINRINGINSIEHSESILMTTASNFVSVFRTNMLKQTRNIRSSDWCSKCEMKWNCVVGRRWIGYFEWYAWRILASSVYLWHDFFVLFSMREKIRNMNVMCAERNKCNTHGESTKRFNQIS